MTAHETAASRRGASYPVAFVAVALVAVVWLIGTGTDISVWQDFRRDVVVRDSYRLDEIADIRFWDASPYQIWLPSDLFVWRSIRSGELPLWDRSQAGGQSPLLNVQNGVMHPLRWMMAAVPFENVPSVLIVAELLVLGLGTYLMLLHALSLSPEASVAGALSLALGGYAMSVIQFSGAMLPLVHAPWIVWAFAQWSRTRENRYAFATIAMTTLLLVSGHPLLIVTAGALAGALVVWISVAERRWRDVSRAVGFALAGLVLGAFAIVPALIGARDVWTYKLGSTHGAPFRSLGPSEFWDAVAASVLYRRDSWDMLDGGSIAYFIGPVALLLALAGLARSLKTRLTAVIIPIVAIGFVLSVPPPFIASFAAATPLRFFKPWYVMFVVALGIAMAVALGAEALLSRLRGAMRGIVATTLLALVVLSLRAPIADGLALGRLREAQNPLLDELRRVDEPFRVVGLHGQTHVPNAGSITALEDVRFSSPLLPLRYREWFRLAAPDDLRESFPTTILPSSVHSPWYGAFNVGYVLRSRLPVHDVHTFLPRPGERPHSRYFIDPIPDPLTHPVVMERPSVTLYENRLGYHARGHFAERAIFVAPGIENAARVMGATGNAGTEVVESTMQLSPQMLGEMTAPAAGDSVRVTYPSNRRVKLVTRSVAPRLLVLHDAWNPGWKAWVDGNATEVMPVSLISRGVMLPAGEHEVEMRFRPVGFVAGVGISAMAAAVLCVVGLRGGRARRERAA